MELLWKRKGIGLVSTLLAVALSGILIFGITKMLRYFSLATNQLEFLGQQHDVKHTVLSKVSCANTLRWQYDACNRGDFVEVRNLDDTVLINRSPTSTMFGELNVRARCTEADGVFNLDFQFRREKNGQPVRSRRTGKISTWTSLFGGTEFLCPGNRIFIATAISNLGSRHAYTQICKSEANAAGLGGEWRALMSLTEDFPIAPSDSAAQAAGQLDAIDYVNLRGPVFNVKGDLIAKDESVFWNGGHPHAVHYDAAGRAISSARHRVMSGTKSGGRYDSQCWTGNADGKGCNCGNFTKGDSGGSPASGCTGSCWRTWCGRPDSAAGWLNVNNPANNTNCTVCIDGSSTFPPQGFYCVETGS